MVTVLLIRHANVDIPPVGTDPSLNAAGTIRAQHLLQIARESGIVTIFTSGLKRTKETVAPLASFLGHTPLILPDTESFIDELKIGHYGDTVLIVGHSNTLPVLIDKLTGTTSSITIGQNDFDNLFVVTHASVEARVLRLKYGVVNS